MPPNRRPPELLQPPGSLRARGSRGSWPSATRRSYGRSEPRVGAAGDGSAEGQGEMEVRGCQGEEQAPEGCDGPPRRPARWGQGCRGVDPARRGGGSGSPPGLRPALPLRGRSPAHGSGLCGAERRTDLPGRRRSGGETASRLLRVPCVDWSAGPGPPGGSQGGEGAETATGEAGGGATVFQNWRMDGLQRAPRFFPFLAPRCAEPHRSPRDPWWEGWKHVFEGTWSASSHSLRSLTESVSLQSNLLIFMEHLLYVRLCPWHCASVSLAVKWDRSAVAEGCGGNGISCVRRSASQFAESE